MCGDDVSGGGAFEDGGFVGFALFLKLVEFGHFPFAAAREAGFLQIEIAEYLPLFELMAKEKAYRRGILGWT